jgi:DNA-binding transcriptional MerR regulator
MGGVLTIQQAAALTGLSAHTLRYYERVGLLDPVDRAPSRHRRYSTADLAWIEFLNRLRATGMPIRQMQQFAALRRQGDRTAHQRRVLLEAHQQAVEERLHELAAALRAIEEKVQIYKDMEEHSAPDSRGDAVHAGTR